MNSVNAATHKSYQTHLISRLQDPTYAAIYLETHLEPDDPDPELLFLALSNVAAALGRSTQQTELQLNTLFHQPGSYAIHHLATWLHQLGLKLTVTPDSPLTNGFAILNLGEISGNVTNTIDHLPTSELADLLKQLQTAIESDTALPEKGKATALEQVNILAEVGKDPDQPEKKSLGQQAITILKTAASFLPDTAKLADAASKLLPLISKALGL
jgi:DNA-binding phage protein